MSLAIRTASSSVEKRAMPATGPNVSSQLIAMSAVTPTSTDGWKNWPSIRSPPTSDLGAALDGVRDVPLDLLAPPARR